MVIGGFIINFFGARFLPKVVAAVAGIVTFVLVMLICSILGML